MEFVVKENLAGNLFDVIGDVTRKSDNENELFYLVDLDDICKKHVNWVRKLPRVIPHYAVKCNDDPMLLKILVAMGAHFDCASLAEINKMLGMGVSSDRIIFANPCKPSSFVKFAKSVNVDYMTFDNEFELIKIKEHHPDAKCVLRIVTDDSNAPCKFSAKFGADKKTSFKLIQRAAELNLKVVGISFHVGSGQLSSEVFHGAIKDARELFDYAREKHNNKMYLLDVGGGFPGADDKMDIFDQIAGKINESLEEFFPQAFFDSLNSGSEDQRLRIIAEPGRYYCCSAFTLCTNIIAKRINEEDDGKSLMYYINDGIFASFNCILYDHAHPSPTFSPDVESKLKQNETPKFKSSLWGPTCDGADLIVKDTLYPEMNIGDYIAFRNMGAYTSSAAVGYNGMPLPRFVYVTPVEAGSQDPETVLEALFKQKKAENADLNGRIFQ